MVRNIENEMNNKMDNNRNTNNDNNSDEITELDLIYDAHDRLDALLNLLEKKGIIKQEEYEEELDKIYETNS